MTIRETGGADSSPAPQGMTYQQRQADSNADSDRQQLPSKPKVPAKWKRVLASFLRGHSWNRFEAEKPVDSGGLSDHCLHSTVAEIQEKGVRISRQFEKRPGYQGIQTEVMRYWLDPGDLDSVDKARDLLGETQRPRAFDAAAEFERRARAERAARGPA